MLAAGFSSLAYLKSRLLPSAGVEEDVWDLAATRLGLSVAMQFQRFCNRDFARLQGAVDEFSARVLSVTLRRYPVEAITSLDTRVFTGAVTDFTGDYSPSFSSGLINFATPPGAETERLIVTYTGGFWLDPMDGTAQPSGSTALPADLLELWVAEVQAQAEMREIFGSVALRKEPKKQITAEGLTAATVEGLRPYRRFSGV
jgi:hypothetical protein